MNRDADGRLSQEEEDAWEDLKAGLKREGETLGKAIDHSLRRFE